RHTRLVSDWSSDVCSSDLRQDVIEAGHKAMLDIVVGNALLAVVVARVLRGEALHVAREVIERLGVSVRSEQRKSAPVADLKLRRSEERRVGKEGRSRWWAE